jgi:sulfur dioxygenase
MADFSTLIGRDDVAVVDIRENGERETQGVVPDAIHVPYPNVAETLRPGGALSQTAETKQLVFVCAYGERSAMAVQLAQSAGLAAARHLHGGLAEWRGLRASRDV